MDLMMFVPDRVGDLECTEMEDVMLLCCCVECGESGGLGGTKTAGLQKMINFNRRDSLEGFRTPSAFGGLPRQLIDSSSRNLP